MNIQSENVQKFTALISLLHREPGSSIVRKITYWIEKKLTGLNLIFQYKICFITKKFNLISVKMSNLIIFNYKIYRKSRWKKDQLLKKTIRNNKILYPASVFPVQIHKLKKIKLKKKKTLKMIKRVRMNVTFNLLNLILKIVKIVQ